eukprot:4849746-Pleurochrysis_carterae.AAC.1
MQEHQRAKDSSCVQENGHAPLRIPRISLWRRRSGVEAASTARQKNPNKCSDASEFSTCIHEPVTTRLMTNVPCSLARGYPEPFSNRVAHMHNHTKKTATKDLPNEKSRHATWYMKPPVVGDFIFCTKFFFSQAFSSRRALRRSSSCAGI